jgi:hypothetical protein
MSEGLYVLEGTKPSAQIGINLHRDESLLTYMDKAEMQATFAEKGLKNTSFDKIEQGASSFNIPMDKPSSFWEILVVFAIVFALAEMAVIKFMNP